MRARHGVGHGVEPNRQVQIGAVLAPQYRQATPPWSSAAPAPFAATIRPRIAQATNRVHRHNERRAAKYCDVPGSGAVSNSGGYAVAIRTSATTPISARNASSAMPIGLGLLCKRSFLRASLFCKSRTGGHVGNQGRGPSRAPSPALAPPRQHPTMISAWPPGVPSTSSSVTQHVVPRNIRARPSIQLGQRLAT